MVVLGLAGKAGVGKDEIADYLVACYGFIKFSFSDALYREVAEAFGLKDESLLRDRATKEVRTPSLALNCCQNKEFIGVAVGVLAGENENTFFPLGGTPLSPRQILQWWGTEYRRAQDPDYWIKRAQEFVFGVRAAFPYPEMAPQYFVNTSARFENERAWIKSLGGNVWHIHRDSSAPVATHVSEAGLPVLVGERQLWNNYTLDYLRLGVDQLLTSHVSHVRMEPPLPMVELMPEVEFVDVPHPIELNVMPESPPLPVGTVTPAENGMYYKVQPDGRNMLCNADGTRSIFDDVDE